MARVTGLGGVFYKVDDPDSAYHGKRMKNGWKNSGVPWTYDCDPALLWTA